MRQLAARLLALGLLGALAACVRVVPRDEWQQPGAVIAALELRAGERIADLGAGEGYFTFRLSEAVGPQGVVYAVDVSRDAIAALERRVADTGAMNVRPLLVPPDDLELPEPVDVIFTCNTFHHIEGQTAYFRRAADRLRPGGRIVVIDMLPSAWLQRITGHVSNPDRIVARMSEAGYTLERRLHFLPSQSFLVFTPEGP